MASRAVRPALSPSRTGAMEARGRPSRWQRLLRRGSGCSGLRIGPRRSAHLGLVPGPFACCDAPGPADPVYVLEGEVTALAALHAPWVGRGWVVAVGGTSGLRRLAADRLPGKGPIVLYADGEATGRLAAREARAAALRMGRAARVVESTQGMDAADELAEWIEERAAIREDGGEPRKRALAEAWRDLARRLRGGGK